MENNLSIVKDKFKELPNNIEAEQSVIGSILVSNLNCNSESLPDVLFFFSKKLK